MQLSRTSGTPSSSRSGGAALLDENPEDELDSPDVLEDGAKDVVLLSTDVVVVVVPALLDGASVDVVVLLVSEVDEVVTSPLEEGG